MRNRVVAFALAFVLVCNLIAPATALAGAAAAGNNQSGTQFGPPGWAGSPDSVQDRLSEQHRDEFGGISAADFRGRLSVSDHASTLDVAVTSQPSINGPKFAMEFRDDRISEGRRVALPADKLQQALGYVPDTATVHHSSGETYTVTLDKTARGNVVVPFRHFSTNTVTFGGTVNISASPASDGSTYSYDVNNLDAVDNFTINVTGRTATAWDNETSSGLTNGATMGLSVAGNLAPTGPSANGEPVVEFAGEETQTTNTPSGSNVNDPSIAVNNGNLDPTGPATGDPQLEITGPAPKTSHGSSTNSRFAWGNHNTYGKPKMEFQVDNAPTTGDIDTLTFNISSSADEDGDVDIYMINEGTDQIYKEGTRVKKNWNPPDVTGEISVPLDTTFSATGSTVTVEVITENTTASSVAKIHMDDSPTATKSTWEEYGGGTSNTYTEYAAVTLERTATTVDATADDGTGPVSFGNISSGVTKSAAVNMSASAQWVNVSHGGGSISYTLNYTNVTATEDPTFDLDGDGTVEASHTGILRAGDTVTSELASLSTSTTSAAVGTAADSSVGVTVEFCERTETKDPTVEVNGNPTSHTGRLSEGQTTSLSTNTSWIQEGTNRVNVSVASPSADAPAPMVGMAYEHGTTYDKSVDYKAQQWSERYNVSRTFESDQQNVEFLVDHAATVYAMRTVKYRKNGGTWTLLGPSEYTLDAGSLTASIGSVTANDTVTVKTVASKVQVNNGAITVTVPTKAGQPLDSKFRVDSWNADSYIAVGGTERSDRIHYTYNESWSADEQSKFTGSEQQLQLPSVPIDGTARVSTIPVTVSPVTNDAVVSVDNPKSTEPSFSVDPGSTAGDDVEFTYLNAQHDTKYVLYSQTNDIVRDSGTANSPITLTDDDNSELLQFLVDDSGGSSTGGGAAVAAVTSTASGLSQSVFIGLMAALLAAAWFLSNTYGGGSISTRMLFLGEAVLIGILALESISPASLIGGVAQALVTFAGSAGQGVAQAMPLVVLAGAGVVYYYLRQRGKPEKVVNFRLGKGGKK